MTTATKNRIAGAFDGNGKAGGESQQITIKPIAVKTFRMRLKGLSPYISHNWSKKSLEMMRDKHAGKRTRNRDVRDPNAEAVAAMYLTKDGQPGIPALAIKSAMLTSAHKDLGIARTLVSKSLFVVCDDPNKILPLILTKEPEFREDVVRVATGSTDLRYRPYYMEWSVDLTLELDTTWLQLGDVISLINRAGYGVGVGEWRPSAPKTPGEYGRFQLDESFPVEEI